MKEGIVLLAEWISAVFLTIALIAATVAAIGKGQAHWSAFFAVNAILMLGVLFCKVSLACGCFKL